MRSSAVTTVSRTSERIDSLRPRRRGGRVRPAAPRAVRRSVGDGIVFVVIVGVSVEKVPRALRRAVAAGGGAVGPVGTEVAATGYTTLQAGRLFAGFTTDAAPFRHEKYSRARGVEYTSRLI